MAERIYTRTGDTGTTGLFGGERVYKDDLRVDAYGTVDELNALLGVAHAMCDQEGIRSILIDLQSALFYCGADLATPLTESPNRASSIARIDTIDIARLEAEIDRLESELPKLTSFILPGGHPVAAAIHHARTVCRRAERAAVALVRAESEASANAPTVNHHVVPYLNRLSDLLFVLARVSNHRYGVTEILWKPQSES